MLLSPLRKLKQRNLKVRSLSGSFATAKQGQVLSWFQLDSTGKRWSESKNVVLAKTLSNYSSRLHRYSDKVFFFLKDTYIVTV